jgi:hypothetical protein
LCWLTALVVVRSVEPLQIARGRGAKISSEDRQTLAIHFDGLLPFRRCALSGSDLLRPIPVESPAIRRLRLLGVCSDRRATSACTVRKVKSRLSPLSKPQSQTLRLYFPLSRVKDTNHLSRLHRLRRLNTPAPPCYFFVRAALSPTRHLPRQQRTNPNDQRQASCRQPGECSALHRPHHRGGNGQVFSQRREIRPHRLHRLAAQRRCRPL